MTNIQLVEKIKDGNLGDIGRLSDLFNALRIAETDDFQYCHNLNKEVRKHAAQLVKTGAGRRALDLYNKTLLFDAPHDFDSYCLYMEVGRDPQKQFYMPRRKQLKHIADALQLLAEDKLELLCISQPPGTGKTGLALFFLTYLAGRNPREAMLIISHNNAFLGGAYSEILRMIDPQGEYKFRDVFPEVSTAYTNAKDMLIDLTDAGGKGKRFATLEFSSIGSGNAGKVRAEQLLYCDDLISGIEQALSREQLDKLWQQYTDDAVQRKIGKHPKELHIATRWSVHDVIGRLEEARSGDPTAKFISIPALDENDESNFDYKYGVGMTTKQYHDIRSLMDDVSWKALYMNQPIEREGLLYSEDELRRYFELPDGEPDGILFVCDTKDRGKDYCVQPIAYQYGQDFYIEDVVCDNSNPEIVEPRLVECLIKNNAQLGQYESNAAGGRIAQKVQEQVKARGGRAKITLKYTTQNKETKIIVNSPWVKEHCLFKMEGNKEYKKFLRFLCSYTTEGKNAHDDVPDAMAQLAEFCQGFTRVRVEAFKRPF